MSRLLGAQSWRGSLGFQVKEVGICPISGGELRVLSLRKTWSILCVRCWLQCGKWFGSEDTKAREHAQRALRCEAVAEEMERRGQIKEMFRRENYKLLK